MEEVNKRSVKDIGENLEVMIVEEDGMQYVYNPNSITAIVTFHFDYKGDEEHRLLRRLMIPLPGDVEGITVEFVGYES